MAAWESSALRQAAKKQARVVIADESIHSGQTLIQTVDLLREAGFRDDDVVVLNPVEPALPDWKSSLALQSLPRVHAVTLEPAERSKQRWLESKAVDERLKEYFRGRNYVDIQVKCSPRTEKLNHEWRTQPPDKVDVRLKRVYEVHLQDSAGNREVRYVLAKSVGSGWLGYHAFVAGQRLGQFVPPILGLRDGILYMEWLPQADLLPALAFDRASISEMLASYVVARAKALALGSNPTPVLGREGRHNGFQMLAYWLSRAYNAGLVRKIQQPRIQRELALASTSQAVMTDSKMSLEEWVAVDSQLVKTDFEHHCQGKNELLMTDPAYDLASAIFYFSLGEEETARMVGAYIEKSGDSEIESRLFMNKLLVGLWAQNRAASGLRHPRSLDRRDDFNQQYIGSWNFLVGQTIRECGKHCRVPERVYWHGPLVVTDIDGVLDRMVFGFPLATAAGIQAISLLHAHGFAIAVNTARTLNEVKLYCRNYGFAGGVAEYGSVIWDAVEAREQVVVSPESLDELERARKALRKIPGVFLNDGYKYSLRAYTLKGERPTAIPSLLVQDVLAGLGVERLRIVHTGLDTAVLAKEIDKGIGLVALQDFVGLHATEVFAIGDSEPDLAMFRVATRSFAPGNISCRREARALGTWIADREYQPGLLQSAQRIVHPRGGACDRCLAVARTWPENRSLFTELLEAADQKPMQTLLRNVWDLSALDVFKK
ncbi:MAG: HAD hydrolase family protein [Candidatus Acidiferrales bacterium]